jgi:alanine dehydrogenase
MTIILSNEDAQAVLPMAECIEELEASYLELARGLAVNNTRSDAVCPTQHAGAVYSLKVMGAVAPSLGVGVVRLNSDIISYANQRQTKLPLAPGKRYTGLVLLFSTDTGEPLAIFPDGVLQLMRVGATSAIGARYLARKDAATVGLIGAGWQAGGHVRAIVAARKIDVVRCYSPTREKREAFCKRMSELIGVAVVPVETPEQAVKGAGIVLCATSSARTVFLERWHEPGMHVTTIRGPELEPTVVRKADVVAVHDATIVEHTHSTRGLEMPRHRHVIEGLDFAASTSLADLVAGTATGRTSPEQKSCFVNLPGIALQFAAVGAAFYRKARAAGRGHEIPTEWLTEDVVP